MTAKRWTMVTALASVLVCSGVLFAQAITVSIDIKPGDVPTVIETDRQGMIPVAILTTAQFNAESVEPVTVTIGPNGTEAAVFRAMLDDVNNDGKIDRLLLFKLQDLNVKCSDTVIRLKGKTTDGRDIEGSETVKVECANP